MVGRSELNEGRYARLPYHVFLAKNRLFSYDEKSAAPCPRFSPRPSVLLMFANAGDRMTSYAENRRYARIFFTREQRIEGYFSMPAEEGGLKVQVLNLSEGGLHFTQKREYKTDIEMGQRLTLTGLQGPDPLKFFQNVVVEIKWILDHEYLEHISYGCQFLDLPDEMREVIRDVVDRGILGSKDQ